MVTAACEFKVSAPILQILTIQKDKRHLYFRYAHNQALMKLLSWRTYVVFMITGIFIGILVTVQVKSALPTSSYIYDELAVQKELIKDYTDQQALLKSKIVTIRGKIEENQNKIRQSAEKNNLDTLKGLKKDIGLETAKGAGVQITIDDGVFVKREAPENSTDSLVAASDLRDVVNLLRTAKADAIAINDQRIISTSPITSVGNTILVNNYNMLPPFNISAIGDTGLIMQRLNDSSSLPELNKRIQEYKIQFSSQIKKDLVIPVYNGNLSIKYLEPQTPNGNAST
jgi:uncharacterized protein YlxW (UPF0749 family)